MIPSKLDHKAITVVVDSREQRPLDLAPLATVSGTLCTGDYTVKGLESVVSLELKGSIGDLLTVVGRDRDRFQREVARILAYPHRLLLINASWDEVDAGGWRGKLTPRQVQAALASWMRDGLPVCLGGTRARCERIARDFLWLSAKREWERLRPMLKTVME